MADKFEVYYPTTGLSTVYFIATQSPGQKWNGTAFEAEVAANWATYKIAGAAGTNLFKYRASPPAGAAGSVIGFEAYLQLGGSAAATDQFLGSDSDLYWNGTTLVGNVNSATLAGVVPLVGDGTTTTVDATHITLDFTNDEKAKLNLVGARIDIITATAGGGQYGIVTASNTGTGQQTIAGGWLPNAILPTGTIDYQVTVAPASGGGTFTIADGSLTAAKFGSNALASQPVASVANLAGVSLSGGTVSASPQPSSTTFTATGNLNTTQGGYASAPMSVFWQTGSNAGFKYGISVHSVSGSNHNFTVGPPMANVPATGDTFVIG